MSQQKPVHDLSLIAKIDLSDDSLSTTSKRYRALKADATERNVTSITGVTDDVIGVQQNLPEATEFVDVAVLGTSKVRLGAAVSYGDLLKIDAGGKFITGGAGTDRNWARALETGGADGDIIEAELFNAPFVS